MTADHETLSKLFLELSQVVPVGTKTQRELELEGALKGCLDAINPPDRAGISMDTWNQRLKAATLIAKNALKHQPNT